MKNNLIRLNDVIARTGLSRSSIYKKIQNRDFPDSISIGVRAVAWVESDIYEWIDERVTLSRTQHNVAGV